MNSPATAAPAPARDKASAWTVRAFAALAAGALLAVLLAPASAWAAAVPTVVYGGDGDAVSVSFDPKDANLFPELADVMPGDELTQLIEVRNESTADEPVRMYLRSLGHSAGSRDFLAQLSLTVEHEDGTLLSSDAAHAAGGLADWVALGEFSPGESAVLTVTLNVPASLDNSFQYASGSVQWEFMAEDLSPDGAECPCDPECSCRNPEGSGGSGDAGGAGCLCGSGCACGGSDGSGGSDADADAGASSGLGSGGQSAGETGDPLAAVVPALLLAVAAATLLAVFLFVRKRRQGGSHDGEPLS